jgi:hypothetical protein
VKLNDAQITAKCVELSKCLVNTGAGFVNYDLRNTRAIGDAARIAVSIRLAGELSEETFAGISTALKVDYRLTRSEMLPLFENLGWVETKKKNNIIQRITEHIPPTEDILSKLGRIWQEQGPTQIDEASIKGLYELSKRPFEQDALMSELNISSKEYETAIQYGEQAHYFGRFQTADNRDAVWTPLYWAGKMGEVTKFLEKQQGEQFSRLASLTSSLIKYPGTPEEKLPTDPLIDAGIFHGYFPSIRIRDRQKKEHEYVFAANPQFEVDPNKDIFERARLIVSCIRHGQYHAEVTTILYPRSVLRAMRNGTMKPHPYADVQYILLKLHGIITLETGATRHGKAFKVKWIDTPENNLAADIADELLKGDEPIVRTREEIDAKQILVQGLFNYSSEQRRIKAATNIQAKEEFNRLIESVAGVKE